MVPRTIDGNIKQAAFFFKTSRILQRMLGRKQSVTKHDNEYHVEFETFGLMNGREPELVVEAASPWFFLGFEIGEQRKLRKEILDGLKLRAVIGHLLEVIEARPIII